MRGKMWFVTGLGVGYVLGTKAGRERFEQIAGTARKVWESPTVQEAAGVVQAQATKLYEQGRQTINEKVHRVTGNGHAPTGQSTDGDWDAAQVKAAPFPSNSF
jgi:hypothetical protein